MVHGCLRSLTLLVFMSNLHSGTVKTAGFCRAGHSGIAVTLIRRSRLLPPTLLAPIQKKKNYRLWSARTLDLRGCWKFDKVLVSFCKDIRASGGMSQNSTQLKSKCCSNVHCFSLVSCYSQFETQSRSNASGNMQVECRGLQRSASQLIPP